MMKNNLFLLALATLLLVSCNKDKGNHLEDDDNVVQITASIDGTADGGTVSAGRATGKVHSTPATRGDFTRTRPKAIT